MTRANTEQLKHTPWFAKAGAACSIVPIARFVGPNVFALKGGGYGCLFSLTGLDEEGLTDRELEARIRQVEGALRTLPEGSCLYQYARVMSGFDLPRQTQYVNEITEAFASDRLLFLQKNAAFRRIDLHWCLTLEPSKVKAFDRKPQENAIETSRMLSDLEKTATLLEGHLASSLGLKLLGKNEAFQFFSYLFNLEEWAAQDKLRSDTGVDRQIVKTPVAWHSDHVQVGKRHIQMFSLKTTPEASRPCLFSGLLTLDCDSVLCSTWRVKSASAARSEIDAQEKFISFFKVGVLTRVMSGRDTTSLDTGAGAKAANNSVDDLSEVIRSLDKKAQGEFSLRLLVAANSPEQLRSCSPAVHRVFVDARAQVIEETLGNLSAFYAMFPGNHKFNVFPMWLSEDHHARLSSVFAPHIGHPQSEDLDSEYLNIFETRTRTPFFQDVYVDVLGTMHQSNQYELVTVADSHLAAHSTRDRKEIHSAAEVLAAHRQIAAEFGNQADKVVMEAHAQEHAPERSPESSQQVARQAVTYARDRSFEREAVTDERDLYRDALRRGMGKTTYSEVRAGFEARVASGEFRVVPGQKHDSNRSFTTAETIRAEKEILRLMQQGQGRAEQIMPINAAVAHTERQQHLNAGQRSAAEKILTSRDVVQGLEGRAGVGKTTLLKAVREAAEQRGYVVEGFAPTSRAANQLRDAGISADTLQGFLVRRGQPSPDRHLYMVDESSLASTKQVRDFLAKLESSDRVLLIGDTRQHQGVEAGKPFEQLVNAGMKTTQLDQIVRQRAAPELLKAVEHLSRGEVAEGVALLEQQGRITEIADAQQRIAAIARSYAANPHNTIVVSPDNASRRQINQAVRSELQAIGSVAAEDHAMRVLAPRSDMTGADRTWAARYAVNDVLHYPRGSQDIGIEKQTYTKVIATQPKDNLLTVQKEDGKTVTYNPARLYGVTAYRELEREFAVGDRLSFTAPSKGLGVANRDLGTVQRIDRDGQLSVKMDNGKAVSFDANQMRHFDHGYAVTSHSSQGLTAERVMVNLDSHVHADLVNKRFAYVAVSRGSHDAHIYTDNASSLVEKLSHDVVKSSAHQTGQEFATDQSASMQL